MRVLLPPSEAKNPGGRGRSFADREPHPFLGAPREQAMCALEALVAGPTDDAAAALLLPPATITAALAMNADVRHSRTLPALRRYAGVVYDGLAAAGLDEREQRAAGRAVLVFSGLFGVVGGDEPIPAYRVPAKAVLPGLGVAGTFWRPHLDQAVPALLGRGLVVDLRSSDYAAMWRPPRTLADRIVTVRVLSPLPAGGRGVVSYPSKFAKGQLLGALVRRELAGAPLAAAEDVVAAWCESGGAGGEVPSPGRALIHTA